MKNNRSKLRSMLTVNDFVVCYNQAKNFMLHSVICPKREKVVFLILLGHVILIMGSCKKFLEVEPPNSKITADLVFQDDGMAMSAMVGIYRDMYSLSSFAGGTWQSVVTLAGLSADELRNNRADPAFLQFENNNIDPFRENVQLLWSSMYKTIYQTNLLMEGLEASTQLTTSIKRQLKGEALFVRAFCYFYLINIFGDVPLALTSDYLINARLHRTTVQDVNTLIIADLLVAEDLLAEAYVGTDRIRPNKSAATALLSRVYLYIGDWENAERKASKVIEKTNLYELPNNLNSVFLLSSREAIWQIRPGDEAYYTNEGYYFSSLIGPLYNVLRGEIMLAYESGDNRKANWTTSVSSGGVTVYLPNKYKKNSFTGGLTTEYSMVLRLAEMYLIRAEARVRKDQLSSAIADIDKIRLRAGLPLIQLTNPGISKADIILAIEQERRIEFAVEWGHRWFDLKRWNRTGIVLAGIKPGFSSTDLLYPLPTSEIRKNPNLIQNPGY